MNDPRQTRACWGEKEIFRIYLTSDTEVKNRHERGQRRSEGSGKRNVEVGGTQWGRERSETGGGGEDQMETDRVKEERADCARRRFHVSLQKDSHKPTGPDSNLEDAHERNNPISN